jgi:hypothetical protein
MQPGMYPATWQPLLGKMYLSLFESVVVIDFQNIFLTEMHQNDIFIIFKKLFLRSAYQNNSRHTKKINFNKKN